ncbi:MAG: ATP-binding cassette domain-containing protein [Pseudomonadota bacterium]
MNLTWKHGAIVACILAVTHLLLGLLPRPPFTAPMNLVLFATNLYVVYCALVTLRGRSGWSLAGFIAGYAALYGLLLGALGKKPLFILLVVAYASVFGSPFLLGLFAVFVVCFVVFQPYSFESFVCLASIYVVIWRARRRSMARFPLWCLAFGLVALAVVLFPLLHLALRDSAQTLWRTLLRPDVRDAVAVSLISSTVATGIVVLFGIPLAYALARLDFPGKSTVETLIDIPILIPQSVAGIALIVLLGPGSPVGEGFGIRISGTLLGIVLAQVFVASPFLIKTALAAFEGVPLELEQASRTLGASGLTTFRRVALPLAGRGIMLGVALSWARAISEFGCIILFASSPVSAPVLVHSEFLRAGASESRPIAILFLIICLWVFVVLKLGHILMPRPFRRARVDASHRAPDLDKTTGLSGAGAGAGRGTSSSTTTSVSTSRSAFVGGISAGRESLAPGLEVVGLCRRFGDFALRNVDLAMARGEYWVLLGPSGCGKSLLLQTLSGLHVPGDGRVTIAGREATVLPPERRGIGLVFQQAALFPHLSVRGNVAYGLTAQRMAASEQAARTTEVIAALGLEAVMARPVVTLSGGEAQRVALARALVIRPTLLLLDEPLSLLDHNARLELQAELRRVHRELGLTTLHVTHDRDEARSMGSHCAVMLDGRIVQTGPVGEVFAAPADVHVARFLGTIVGLPPCNQSESR